jgi:glycosyltransferase involved in cell wall biosynthesis
MSSQRLSVALIAGGLGHGGAEKQLLYMARALMQRGAEVRCFCLTRGEHYESAFDLLGLTPVWLGRHGAPPLRLALFASLLRASRPRVVQAGHFFANLYAAAGARACGAVSVGAVRNDGAFELRENPGWGPWLMRTPTVLLANSQAGAQHARRYRGSPGEVIVVPNVIDLQEFDAVQTDVDLRGNRQGPIAIAVGRLVAAKRYDRFLAALALARRQVPALTGVIVGDGPLRASLEMQARALGLDPETLRFIGARPDVPGLLRQVDFLVSTSEHEGFPNVMLEAMAARLPVIATLAGDAARVMLPGTTGFVAHPPDVGGLADRMVLLASQPQRQAEMGVAARKRVECRYAADTLGDRLMAVYEQARLRRAGATIARTALGMTPGADQPGS